MNSAYEIASTLDQTLDRPAQAIVFGSAALLLASPPSLRSSLAETRDIDIVIPTALEAAFDADPSFLHATERANKILEPDGRYISHIFPESEVVLPADWASRVTPIPLPFQKLTLLRPHAVDLAVSRMGRGDLGDLKAVRALAISEALTAGSPLTVAALERAASIARVPEIYRPIFPAARDAILSEVAELNHRATPPRLDRITGLLALPEGLPIVTTPYLDPATGRPSIAVRIIDTVDAQTWPTDLSSANPARAAYSPMDPSILHNSTSQILRYLESAPLAIADKARAELSSELVSVIESAPATDRAQLVEGFLDRVGGSDLTRIPFQVAALTPDAVPGLKLTEAAARHVNALIPDTGLSLGATQSIDL